MKCLLVAINAKYIHSNLAVFSLRANAGPYRPLVELGEYTINSLQADILRDIYRRKPDIIGISCYVWNMEYVGWLLKELPKVLPETKIWLGGPEVSYDPEQVLTRYPMVEGVMLGEGEALFLQLMAFYADGKGRLEELSGIAIRHKDGTAKVNSWAPFLSMDELEFPYGDLEDFQNRIIYYESSRGCPFSCCYCLSSLDKRVRFRSMDKVLQELQFFIDRRVPQVKFVDRTFNCRRDRTLGIWSYILDHDNGITNFHFEITSDLLDEEELQLLERMRPGLVQLEIGVQSTNPKTIEVIERRMDLERVKQNVNRINSFHNIHQHLDLIAGLPYEDYETFGNSFDEVYAMRPQQLQLGFLKVLKGSKMLQQASSYGLVYLDSPPYEVLSTSWLDYGEVLGLKAVEEMVEVFYNSGQFQNSIAYLEHFFARPFSLYEALAGYYHRNGLFQVSHNRMARYEHLYGFADEVEGVNPGVFVQVLIFDLYLRENVKNRPAFAGSGLLDKQVQKDFYRNEASHRQHLKGYEDFDERQMAKMTHMEKFTCDIEASAKAGNEIGKEQCLVFDYRFREPFYHNAGIIRVEGEQR